ncbi:MAG: serine hydrolase [Alphaproteobacteria bacterium]|nr:serine hydrolase [Alphaproteobacteria bacterium]
MRQRSGRSSSRARGAPRAGLLAWILLAASVAQAQTITRDKVDAALPALEATAQRAVASKAVPGLAIAVVFEGAVVFMKGFGLREIGKPEKVDADTVFQLASLSKPISSTVVAALVGEGTVSWDSRIVDLDPGFRLHDPYPTAELTVRDLFAHRSGLPGSAGDELEEIGYDRTEILKRLRLAEPSSGFRAGYSYSNFGLTEGAVAAAKPTGKSWEEVAEERLYRLLSMTSTSSRHADFLNQPDRAELHVTTNGEWTARLKRDPDAQAPAGGVNSSVRDLAQWVRLELDDGVLDGKRLIDARALRETHFPLMARGENPVNGGTSFYGLGWGVEFGPHGLAWTHAGAFSVGARTLATLYPQAKLGIVVLANAFPTGVPEGLADSFADLAFDGRVSRDWTASWNALFEGMFAPAAAAAKAKYAPPGAPAPGLSDAAYVGRYANAYVGVAQVAAENGGLVLRVGPGGKRTYPLLHFDRDTFLCFATPEAPDWPSAVQFSIGPDGKASRVTIESLNGIGLGALDRIGD